MRRAAVLVAAGLVAVVAGCDYTDTDFATECAGNQWVRAIDADGTHAVAVDLNSFAYDAVGDTDVDRTFDLAEGTLPVTFLLGHDLDEVDLEPESSYCPNLTGGEGGPDPVIDQTLTATGGTVVVHLDHAKHIGSVRGSVSLEDVELSDGETTVPSLAFEDLPIGRYS